MFPKDMQAALPQNGKKNLYYRQVPGDVLQELWRRYLEAIEPLREAGQLGAVHFQFASWMANNTEGRMHVAHCADVMAVPSADLLAGCDRAVHCDAVSRVGNSLLLSNGGLGALQIVRKTPLVIVRVVTCLLELYKFRTNLGARDWLARLR